MSTTNIIAHPLQSVFAMGDSDAFMNLLLFVLSDIVVKQSERDGLVYAVIGILLTVLIVKTVWQAWILCPEKCIRTIRHELDECYNELDQASERGQITEGHIVFHIELAG